MTQSLQSISNTLAETKKMQYTTSSLISAHLEEPKKEDNLNIMSTLCDSVDELYITLEKLDHILKMKIVKLGIKLEE